MCNLFGKVIIFAIHVFPKVVQQQYVGKVGKSLIVVLQIKLSIMCAKYIL